MEASTKQQTEVSRSRVPLLQEERPHFPGLPEQIKATEVPNSGQNSSTP